MLLRRSGENNDKDYQLEAVTGASEGEVGVENESLLLEIADAVYFEESNQMAVVRERALDVIGENAVVDAIGVAAGFNGITKIANATGIPLDDTTEQSTVEMRQMTQIDEYAEAHKSKLWD